MFWWIRRFISKIIKIVQYIPILWEDEDWDYDYLLTLIQYKLKRMRATLWSNKIVEHRELRDTIIDINRCIQSIDDYHDAHEVYETYYEPAPVKVGHRTETDPENPHLSKFIDIDLETGKDLTERQNSLYLSWIKRTYEFEQEKWKEIWYRISDYAQKFWD